MIVKKLANLNRFYKTILMILSDFFIVYASNVLVWYLKTGSLNIFDFIKTFVLTAFISLPIFIFFGLYKSKVRYMGYKAMLNIVYATAVVSVIAPFVFYVDSIYVAFEADQLIRHIILFWLVSSFLIIGTRQIARFVIN